MSAVQVQFTIETIGLVIANKRNRKLRKAVAVYERTIVKPPYSPQEGFSTDPALSQVLPRLPIPIYEVCP